MHSSVRDDIYDALDGFIEGQRYTIPAKCLKVNCSCFKPEVERAALMRLVQAHTDDVEVNNMIKSAAETLIEKSFGQGFAIGFEEGRIIGKTKVIQQDITKNIAKIVEQGIAIGIERGIAKDIEKVIEQAKAKVIQQGIAKDIEKVIEQAKAIGIERDIAIDTDKTIEQGIVIGIEKGIAKVIEQAKAEIYRAWHADWEKRTALNCQEKF